MKLHLITSLLLACSANVCQAQWNYTFWFDADNKILHARLENDNPDTVMLFQPRPGSEDRNVIGIRYYDKSGTYIGYTNYLLFRTNSSGSSPGLTFQMLPGEKHTITFDLGRSAQGITRNYRIDSISVEVSMQLGRTGKAGKNAIEHYHFMRKYKWMRRLPDFEEANRIRPDDSDLIKEAKRFVGNAGNAPMLPLLGKSQWGNAVMRGPLLYKWETVPCWEQARCRQTLRSTEIIVPLQAEEPLYAQMRLREVGKVSFESGKTRSKLILQKQGRRISALVLTYLPDSLYAATHEAALDTLGGDVSRAGYSGLLMISNMDGSIRHSWLYKKGRVRYKIVPRMPELEDSTAYRPLQELALYHTSLNFYQPSVAAQVGGADGFDSLKQNEGGCVVCGKPWDECRCTEVIAWPVCENCQLPRRDCVCGTHTPANHLTLDRLMDKEWVRQSNIPNYPMDVVKTYSATQQKWHLSIHRDSTRQDDPPYSYYLSNEVDTVFDERKVGWYKVGKYIIANSPRGGRDGTPETYTLLRSRIVKLTDTELVEIGVKVDKRSGRVVEDNLPVTWKRKPTGEAPWQPTFGFDKETKVLHVSLKNNYPDTVLVFQSIPPFTDLRSRVCIGYFNSRGKLVDSVCALSQPTKADYPKLRPFVILPGDTYEIAIPLAHNQEADANPENRISFIEVEAPMLLYRRGKEGSDAMKQFRFKERYAWE
ncbi:MAG: hypothetical protein LBM06_03510 [Prevotellaceae bacterium]|jgi:hypothetical protein|nr:hypothetical protein [Prevotellaceae bacterium]